MPTFPSPPKLLPAISRSTLERLKSDPQWPQLVRQASLDAIIEQQRQDLSDYHAFQVRPYGGPMSKLFTLVALLLAVQAHAGGFTATFESPVWSPSGNAVGVLSGGGITASFGQCWNICRDSDAGGPEAPRWGWIANEPSGQQAAGCIGPSLTTDVDITITSGTCRYVELWYTTDCIGVPDGGGGTITAQAENWSILDQFLLQGHGYNQSTNPACVPEACVGDPNGYYCRWRKVTLSSPAPAAPIKRVTFQYGSTAYFWIDDIRFLDTSPPPCPNPPCEVE